MIFSVRQHANKIRVLAAIALLLGSSLIGLTHPEKASAGGYITWIDPGCYGPTTGHAEPGYHWWGQFFNDGGGGYAYMTYGNSGTVSDDPAGGFFRTASGSDVTINFHVGSYSGIGRYTTTLMTEASFYSGIPYHTEFIDCY